MDGHNFGVPVTLSDGVATIPDSALSVSGSPHTITASFSGDASFSASSGTLSGGQTVTPAATIATVTASPSSAALGVMVTFTATVRRRHPRLGHADGCSRVRDGRISSTQKRWTTARQRSIPLHLALGSHSITAFYGGFYGSDPNFQPTTSPILHEQINRPVATTTTLAVSANPAVFGGSVTFTATVKSKSRVLMGMVVFKDGGVTLGTGTPIGGGKFTFNTSSRA